MEAKNEEKGIIFSSHIQLFEQHYLEAGAAKITKIKVITTM